MSCWTRLWNDSRFNVIWELQISGDSSNVVWLTKVLQDAGQGAPRGGFGLHRSPCHALWHPHHIYSSTGSTEQTNGDRSKSKSKKETFTLRHQHEAYWTGWLDGCCGETPTLRWLIFLTGQPFSWEQQAESNLIFSTVHSLGPSEHNFFPLNSGTLIWPQWTH